MLIKVRARQLGKRIKKETDIPHIPAMKIGKMLAQHKNFSDIQKKFPAYVHVVKTIHCECCGPGYTDFLGVEADKEQLKLWDIAD